MMRAEDPPSACAATMKSTCLSARVLPRTTRVYTGMDDKPTAIITFCRLRPSTAMMTKASRMPGKASIMSMKRMISISAQPPR